jgi:hypothetical protein
VALADIRGYFASRMVRVLQRDAVERLGLRRLLTDAELLAGMELEVLPCGVRQNVGRCKPREEETR